ncbi:hypothetical protein BP5796_05462 [Coleophoma crateriformis]|uniref:Uncharacterized protein n=1 Tax=Coleophoma crateriformis TaxID=565419 RepID=A0A3D8S3W7_9HELO|nr:hypothetical protein BP5796_05462 [Coleophoma crateriformis]
MSEVYDLAKTVQRKLLSEANKKSHNLRLLCGHANLYDVLLQDISYAPMESNEPCGPYTKQEEIELRAEATIGEWEVTEVEIVENDIEDKIDDDGEDLNTIENRNRSHLLPRISLERKHSSINSEWDSDSDWESDSDSDQDDSDDSDDLDPDLDPDNSKRWNQWDDEYSRYHADFVAAVLNAMGAQSGGHDGKLDVAACQTKTNSVSYTPPLITHFIC